MQRPSNQRSQVLIPLLLLTAATPALAIAGARVVPGIRSQPLLNGSPAVLASTQDAKKFKEDFNRYMTVGNIKEGGLLMSRNTQPAVEWIMVMAEILGSGRARDSDQELMNNLRKAWKSGMRSNFAGKMEAYFALMDPTDRRERVKLRKKYDVASREFWKQLNGEAGAKSFGVLSHEFTMMGEDYGIIGDKYYASQCWAFVGQCNDKFNRKKEANLKAACDAFGRFLSLRKEIELRDRTYTETEERYNYLVANGYGKRADAGEEGGEAGPVAPKEASTAITAAMTFEMIEDIGRFERPSYFLDPNFPAWNSLGLKSKGTKVSFPRLGDSVTLHRVAANDVRVDVDGDGEPDVRIPLTGNVNPIQISLGEGDEKREWAFLTIVGGDKEAYNSVQVNLQPQGAGMTIYYSAAGSVTGMLGEVPVRVIDDNLDGIYGSPPIPMGHSGLTKDIYQPEMDSIVIGSSKRAKPWSEYQKIEDKWYRLEIANAGMELSASEVELPTGTLKLKFGGGKPTWLIVRGVDDYENSFFDLAGAGSKGAEVPVGRYSLFYGELRKGKKRQMLKAVILPGDNTTTWNVEAGETVEVQMGKPFGFDFKIANGTDTVEIIGTSIAVVGSARERYERMWSCVPKVEASYRKTGARSPSLKGKKMPVFASQDDLFKLGWAAAWFPKSLTLDKKRGDAEVEVQLVDKKHKLFGKITSEWKD